MDSLTVHYLARELDGRWRGRRIVRVELDRVSRSITISVEGDEAVRFDLSRADVHPTRADIGSGGGGALVGWTVERVEAPLDDRRIVVVLSREGRFRGSPSRRATIEISVVPTMRGAVVREQGGRVLEAIGSPLPKRRPSRPELSDEQVATAIASQDAEALLAGRWMSPVVVAWLLADPAAALERYRSIRALEAPRPVRAGATLYPLPIGGEPVRSLVAEAAVPVEAAPAQDDRRDRALRRLRAELERATRAPRVRALADALAPLGPSPPPLRARLADGSEVEVEAQPGERAIDVAERLYAEVRSMERALARLPARIEALERAAPEAPRPARARGTRRRTPGPARPYRSYRSRGGVPIWVGRGASANDTLTFELSSPDDVWMHARQAGGAHVVLRWTRAEPPPARDLEDAAMLAAWHSQARGSAVVPVDWTRRKYVRKPRGAPPGRVIVQRSETIFVRPTAAMERALRAREEPDGEDGR